MSERVGDILKQLGTSFTVRDIMISYEDFAMVNSEREVGQFFDLNQDYDYTASLTRGQITTYYRRGELEGFDLRQEDLLSDGTSLLDLLELMANREFFFVLSANKIRGFVHFSDLNHELVKLPLFVLLAAVESRLWFNVKEGLTEGEVEYVMNPGRFDVVRQHREKARQKNVDRGWEGLLYFREILELARNRGLVEATTEDRELLNDTRNRVAHHNRLLIEEHKDIRKLARVRNLCRELMHGISY